LKEPLAKTKKPSELLVGTKIPTAANVTTGGRLETGSSLDTLAQLDRNGGDPAVLLGKRARAKSFSLPLATALADLRSPLEKSYRSTVYCSSSIAQVDGQMKTKYCGQRWCLVCNRIRTARAVDNYLPIIETWEAPHMVTLTVRNCGAEELSGTFDLLLDTFTSCKRSITGTHRLPFVALRKMECTYNGTDYHPHLHIIVAGAEQAELLRSIWLKRLPGLTDAKAQDVRPCDGRSVTELTKYFTKLTTKTAGTGGRSVIGVEHLDTIFRAMKGRRVYQSVGFTLPKEIEETIEGEKIEVQAMAAYKRPEESISWDWQQVAYDWVDLDSGELLSDYDPSPAYVEFIATVGGQDEGQTVLPQWLSGDAADPCGSSLSYSSLLLSTAEILTTNRRIADGPGPVLGPHTPDSSQKFTSGGAAKGGGRGRIMLHSVPLRAATRRQTRGPFHQLNQKNAVVRLFGRTKRNKSDTLVINSS
jgi:hypothetical protein